eukprot:scaffold14307_cov177-Cylindrotheca_fusiformis.AAC.5
MHKDLDGTRMVKKRKQTPGKNEQGLLFFHSLDLVHCQYDNTSQDTKLCPGKVNMGEMGFCPAAK